MTVPLVILHITDLHILAESKQILSGIKTEQSFCQVLKQAHFQHGRVDLIIVTGDLAETPCQSSYQRIYQILEKYQTQTLCLSGNHDNFSLMQEIFNTQQINCDPLIQFKHWQIICLNSQKQGTAGGYLHNNELDFLKKSLTKQPEINTLIAVHHPPFPINSAWMDTMMIKNSEALFSLLEGYSQVKGIICGHVHQALEAQKNKLSIFTSPSTCFQFKPNSEVYELDDKSAGYRLLWLYPSGEIKSKSYWI